VGPQGQKGDTGPAGVADSLMLIPFASRTAAQTSSIASGAPANAATITFGGQSTVGLSSTGSVTLGGDNQDAFTLPFDAIIENIYVTFNTYTNYTIPPGITVYPFLQLYVAQQTSNSFTPMSLTKIVASPGYNGTVPSHTARSAVFKQIGLRLAAGTRVLIGGHISLSGSGTLAQRYSFYFTGGIAVRMA
jgi:hypothetical protein